jgi:hypothetical protein
MNRHAFSLLGTALLAAFLLCANAAAEGYIFLTGDLHCHSSFSPDSQVPYAQVIRDSIAAGYDFLSLTEHDTKSHLHTDLSVDGLIVLAGYELTMGAGHYNLFGIRDFIKKDDLAGKRLTDYITYLHGKGALVQIDHPYNVDYFSAYGLGMDVDLVEVLNGRPTTDDYMALSDWQAQLCLGRRLVATGGTDAHSNYSDRHVFNHMLASARTSEAILDGIRAGRLYITTAKDGPAISMACGNAVMGDTVPYADGLAVNIVITGIPSGCTVIVCTNTGAISETAAAGSFENLCLPLDVLLSDARYSRVTTSLPCPIRSLSSRGIPFHSSNCFFIDIDNTLFFLYRIGRSLHNPVHIFRKPFIIIHLDKMDVRHVNVRVVAARPIIIASVDRLGVGETVFSAVAIQSIQLTKRLRGKVKRGGTTDKRSIVSKYFPDIGVHEPAFLPSGIVFQFFSQGGPGAQHRESECTGLMDLHGLAFVLVQAEVLSKQGSASYNLRLIHRRFVIF